MVIKGTLKCFCYTNANSSNFSFTNKSPYIATTFRYLFFMDVYSRLIHFQLDCFHTTFLPSCWKIFYKYNMETCNLHVEFAYTSLALQQLISATMWLFVTMVQLGTKPNLVVKHVDWSCVKIERSQSALAITRTVGFT